MRVASYLKPNAKTYISDINPYLLKWQISKKINKSTYQLPTLGFTTLVTCRVETKG